MGVQHMGRQERFLKWLVEEEKVSIDTVFTHGQIAGSVMLIGFYEKWRNTTECGRQLEWDAPYFTELQAPVRGSVVEGNHPIAEAIARKLFGIESVPKEEQKRMVRRAIKTAVEVHDSIMSKVTKS